MICESLEAGRLPWEPVLLLVTSMILHVAIPQVSNARARIVTLTILLFGGQRLLGVADTSVIVGGFVSVTVIVVLQVNRFVEFVSSAVKVTVLVPRGKPPGTATIEGFCGELPAAMEFVYALVVPPLLTAVTTVNAPLFALLTWANIAVFDAPHWIFVAAGQITTGGAFDAIESWPRSSPRGKAVVPIVTNNCPARRFEARVGVNGTLPKTTPPNAGFAAEKLNGVRSTTTGAFEPVPAGPRSAICVAAPVKLLNPAADP